MEKSSEDATRMLLDGLEKQNSVLVEKAINAGANVNAIIASTTAPYLSVPVYRGNINLIKLLIEHGADTDLKTSNGRTALHQAAKFGYLDVVECLVNSKANVNCTDNFGDTPFHLNIEYSRVIQNRPLEDRISIARFLAGRGANINAQNSWGDTPLHVCSKDLVCLTWLLAHGAHPYIVNKSQKKPFDDIAHSTLFVKFPLIRALLTSDLKEAQLIVASYYYGKHFKKAEPNMAIHIAAALGYFPIVHALLTHLSSYISTADRALSLTAAQRDSTVFFNILALLDPSSSDCLNLLTDTELTAAIKKALNWALINRQVSLVHEILNYAFILNRHPSLDIQQTHEYLHYLLRKKDMPYDDRILLSDLHQKFVTIDRFRHVLDKLAPVLDKPARQISFIDALTSFTEKKLPMEIITHILELVLSLNIASKKSV